MKRPRQGKPPSAKDIDKFAQIFRNTLGEQVQRHARAKAALAKVRENMTVALDDYLEQQKRMQSELPLIRDWHEQVLAVDWLQIDHPIAQKLPQLYHAMFAVYQGLCTSMDLAVAKTKEALSYARQLNEKHPDWIINDTKLPALWADVERITRGLQKGGAKYARLVAEAQSLEDQVAAEIDGFTPTLVH